MVDLIARRVAPGVPIWDILANGENIGCMTDLPMERAVCVTVVYRTTRLDLRAPHIRDVLSDLRGAIDRLEDAFLSFDEDPIEDEDGEVARMRHAENMAEAYFMRQDMQEPAW